MKGRDGNEWVLVPVNATVEMVTAARYLLPSVPAVCMDDAINRAIAAAPQFVAGEVTDDVAARVLTHFSNFPVRLSNAQNGHDMIAAVRSELGPALGLVEIREPTPEECERIDSVYASLDRTSHGRAMFNAVRNVMWPKEGL